MAVAARMGSASTLHTRRSLRLPVRTVVLFHWCTFCYQWQASHFRVASIFERALEVLLARTDGIHAFVACSVQSSIPRFCAR